MGASLSTKNKEAELVRDTAIAKVETRFLVCAPIGLATSREGKGEHDTASDRTEMGLVARNVNVVIMNMVRTNVKSLYRKKNASEGSS